MHILKLRYNFNAFKPKVIFIFVKTVKMGYRAKFAISSHVQTFTFVGMRSEGNSINTMIKTKNPSEKSLSIMLRACVNEPHSRYIDVSLHL